MRAFSLFIFSLALAGCASFYHDGDQQRLLVRSESPGVEIYHQGKKVGVTPDIVFVERSFSPTQLMLQSGEQTKIINLQSKYRWQESFLYNLGFLSLAPIGWIVDVLTGAAYEYPNVYDTSFLIDKKENVSSVAIAPPQTKFDTEYFEDVSLFINKKLTEELADHRVLDYNKTSHYFTSHNYNQFGRGDKDDKKTIFQELKRDLGVDAVYESNYNIRPNLEITGSLQKLNEQEAQQIDLAGESSELKSFNELAWKRKAGIWYSFIPNSAYVQTSNRSAEIKIDDVRYEADDIGNKGDAKLFKDIFSSTGIGFLRKPTKSREWLWRNSFVPRASMSFVVQEYRQSPVLAGTGFEKFHIAGGYGWDTAMVSRHGALYFQIVPTYIYEEVKWQQNNEDRKESDSNISILAELGYSFYIYKRWNISLFSQSIGENRELWQNIVNQTTNSKDVYQVESSSNFYSGIRLSYYFPDTINPLHGVF